jgi:hypothetical protein
MYTGFFSVSTKSKHNHAPSVYTFPHLLSYSSQLKRDKVYLAGEQYMNIK